MKKQNQYMGMDVHQATTVVAVVDAEGKMIVETIVKTEASAILRLIQGLSGPLHVTFEETTQADWLHDVVRHFVAEVVVCPRWPPQNRPMMATQNRPLTTTRGTESFTLLPSVEAIRFSIRFLASRTIRPAWMEDRATLGSDPSANPGAETEAGCRRIPRLV